MSIFLTFIPWIVQGVLSSISLPLSLGVATLLSLLLLLKSRYTMQWVTFLFFLVGFIVSPFVSDGFFQNVLPLLSSVVLGLVAWVSLWLNKPFTLQYAKEQVPQEYWTHFLFLRINNIMTTVFGVVFTLQAALKMLKAFCPDLLPYSYFIFALTGCPILFVLWFPEWYKKTQNLSLSAETKGRLEQPLIPYEMYLQGHNSFFSGT